MTSFKSKSVTHVESEVKQNNKKSLKLEILKPGSCLLGFETNLA